VSLRDSWQYFQWLFSEGLEVVRLPVIGWACSLAAVCLVVLFLWQKQYRKGLWRHYYLLALTQLLFYPAVITVGVCFRNMNYPGSAMPRTEATGLWTIQILFFASLAEGLFWIFRMKGLRWYVLCCVAILQLLLWGAAFVAEMSVTGDWI
jgi:hypothetical protein